jgi:nucleotide-binding universal stress UspA family protein
MSNVPGARRVVVGVDGSPESVAALMWACREASLRDADVLAVLAVEAACHRVASYAGPRPAHQTHGSWGAARDVLRRAVSDAAERFGSIAIRAEIAEGLAARILLDRAAGADILVLGSTKHGSEHHRGAGPVIRACLRAASCPVVVVGLEQAVRQQAADAAEHVSTALHQVLAQSFAVS